MKSKKLFAFFGMLISVIFLATSYSPELAIRRHLFFVNPAQSLTCTINKTNFDGQYTINGINGIIDPQSGGKIFFAYVKRNFIGMYYWSGGGSGP